MPYLPRSFLALTALSVVLTGCRDASVASYRIPKEKDVPQAGQAATSPAGDMTGGAVSAASGAELVWTAPAEWKPKPGSSVRKGSYTIGEEGAPAADLAITAFPGDVGGDLANVNRWRSQLQMAPIADAELAPALTHLDHNGLHMNLVELVSGDAAVRMLSVIVPFDGATWFFKLTGPSDLVASVKPAFLEFLKTIKPGLVPEARDPHAGLDLPGAIPASLSATAGDSMANTAVTTAGGPELKWTAPAHWESKTGSPMRKGSYLVKGEGGETADLSITAFPGDVGGELANVNRWRNQLQLPPLGAAELDGAAMRQQRNGLGLTIVDLAGAGGAAGQRMIGAIVPFGGATWFFKLAGPDALVVREKAAFLAFLDTLQTP